MHFLKHFWRLACVVDVHVLFYHDVDFKHTHTYKTLEDDIMTCHRHIYVRIRFFFVHCFCM
jgi:hypothetical protein